MMGCCCIKYTYDILEYSVLFASDDTQFLDDSLYRSIIGGSQYLTFTRPDISFSMNKVSQFMHSPTEKHQAAVKRILRYLKSNSSRAFFFPNEKSLQLQGYCDADQEGSIDDRNSATGFAIF